MREILTSYKEKTETNSVQSRMSQFCYFRFNFNSLGSFLLHDIMDRIVHNSINIESGNVNMRERVHKNNK